MTFTFWMLIGSGICILGLISYKGFESTRGGVLFAPLFRKRLDNLVENSGEILMGYEDGFSKHIQNSLNQLPHKINILLHGGWKKISKKVDGYFERLRGHHNIVKK